MFSQNEKVGQQIWLAFKESPTKEQWREKCAEKMCWLSETQIIIQPDPKLKADVDRLKQLVLWADRAFQPVLQQEEVEELGISDEELREPLERVDGPLGLEDRS
jgi:hypothetical protein